MSKTELFIKITEKTPKGRYSVSTPVPTDANFDRNLKFVHEEPECDKKTFYRAHGDVELSITARGTCSGDASLSGSVSSSGGMSAGNTTTGDLELCSVNFTTNGSTKVDPTWSFSVSGSGPGGVGGGAGAGGGGGTSGIGTAEISPNKNIPFTAEYTIPAKDVLMKASGSTSASATVTVNQAPWTFWGKAASAEVTIEAQASAAGTIEPQCVD